MILIAGNMSFLPVLVWWIDEHGDEREATYWANVGEDGQDIG